MAEPGARAAGAVTSVQAAATTKGIRSQRRFCMSASLDRGEKQMSEARVIAENVPN
jgi:hypothetical protein